MYCFLMVCWWASVILFFFFFNDTATTEIYTLSLHDALPISAWAASHWMLAVAKACCAARRDRKSTRLNSSHITISYAVFCLKKKKKTTNHPIPQQKKQKHTNTNIETINQ